MFYSKKYYQKFLHKTRIVDFSIVTEKVWNLGFIKKYYTPLSAVSMFFAFYTHNLIVWHKVNSIYSYRLLFFVQKWERCVGRVIKCLTFSTLDKARTMKKFLYDSSYGTYDIHKQVSSSANRIQKIFRHAEYESARRDLDFFMGIEVQLLVL